VRDPDDGTTEGPTETLQAGPSRPPLFPSLPARWRQRAAAPVALVLGVVAGAGTVLWWQLEPAPTPFRADEHDVELILFEAVRNPGGTGSEAGPLRIDGALLLSGTVASTVSRIETTAPSLDVRAPTLPVTVSPTDRFRSVELWISVRDCETATSWAPTDRPFTIAWRDEFDMAHTDRAGDFDRTIANALLRYIDEVCPDA